jgi:pyruvate dehydrogenase E2 component (dihydrolipoamide acetyltransferase)
MRRLMVTKVIMPQMGESISEGTLTKWLKKVGEPVVRDEPLFEISSDKVDSEIPSPASGILSEILIPEGATVQINAVLAIIREPGTDEPADAVPNATTAEEAPAAMPEGSNSSPHTIKTQTASTAGNEPPKDSRDIRVQDVRTSPLVRRLAREHQIDLSAIQGTGLEGRITKDDVLQYLEKPSADSSAPAPEKVIPQSIAGAATPSESASPPHSEMARFMGESEMVPMTVMRKAIAQHMVLSKKVSAHVNTVFEVDVSPIVQLREQNKEDFQEREGIALTFTPFFAKGLIDTVREFPIFNTSVSGDNIVYKKPIHLGIAVALEAGLIVPVVRDAHLKNFTGLALAIHDLASRARTKRLKPDEVQNGTISMTNPGSFGALFATPIIHQPQVAILGIGGIEKRPVVINDAIAIRSMVCLSLTFDHRLIDGSVADRFMARLKERFQGWVQWID